MGLGLFACSTNKRIKTRGKICMQGGLVLVESISLSQDTRTEENICQSLVSQVRHRQKEPTKRASPKEFWKVSMFQVSKVGSLCSFLASGLTVNLTGPIWGRLGQICWKAARCPARQLP